MFLQPSLPCYNVVVLEMEERRSARTWDTQIMLARIRTTEKDITSCFALNTQLSTSVPREIYWNKPLEGWVKVNVDGSCKGTPTRVGFGGVIRNHMGNWIHGFSGYFGKVDILCAELHGMKVGLSLAWDLHYRRIILESDSKEAFQLITMDCTPPFHVYDMVIVDIQWLLKRSWVVEVNRMLREANYCTNAMAK